MSAVLAAHPLESLAELPPKSTASTDEKHSLEKAPSADVEAGVLSYDDAPPPYDILSGKPLPDVDSELPEETQTLTIRAILIGCALGAVVQASNLYLGLKTGFTFGPQLFGAIFGFAILKPLSRIAPKYLGGGYFGEKENVTCQSAATAAGGLGIIYVSGIPAMYQLGLLSASPVDDIGRLLGFTMACALFGMSFAIPLRKWYILRMKLVFPTPTATALTIRALHSGRAGAEAARKKSKAILSAFGGAITLRVASGYAPGVLWDWHPFWWLASWGWTSVLAADNYGFFLEWTPAFLGAGVLSGVNASLSLYAGGVFFWGVLAPLLMKYHDTVARDFSADYNGWPVFNYNKMSFADPKGLVSPRYWIIWLGVFGMLLIAFTEIAVQGHLLAKGAKEIFQSSSNAIARRQGKEEKYDKPDTADIDPAKPEDMVPVWAWTGMMAVAIVITVVVMSKLFHVNAGISILAMVLGFIFSFIGVQSAGTTDINPISTCAKASQIVVGGATHGQQGAITTNLLAALVSGAAAAQATDMTGDLKTGHLLKAKPRNQFVAQTCGALVSVFLSTGLFVLFAKAYPCITNADADTCPFGIPSVSAWLAVAKATTSTSGLPFPKGSAIATLIYGIVVCAIVVVKARFVPEPYRQYMPNMMAFSLSAVLPPGNSQFGLAMAIGSVASWYWKKRSPATHDMYMYPIAAGGIAGEGIGGVVNAILVVAGVDGSIYGTAAGCPGNIFCG